jgi:hypothetical protein
MRVLLILFVMLVGITVLIFGSFWLAFSRHEFGPYDPRVLVFVRSTRTARIAIIHPVPGSLRFVAEGPDGPGVGFLSASYRTRTMPANVVAAFLAGCAAERLTPIGSVDDGSSADGETRVACERDDLVIRLSVKGESVAVLEDRPS